MSSKAQRVTTQNVVERFPWQTATPTAMGEVRRDAVRTEARPGVAADPQHLEALERDAFVKGYAQGERAGMEAAATKGQAMLRRLGETLQELASLRAEMIRRTERQIVQLALAIAERVIRREISLDRGLLHAMARVALDRLGEHASATIRLHPDDFAAAQAGHASNTLSEHVKVVADSLVSRGGCLVQSDFGFMDVDVAAQFHELSKTLFEEDEAVAAHAMAVVNDGVSLR
ncbi:MAG TPA: FliH/SctL family protein [Vicinamibacterales bacterium]|nr:FliH/SctL family protein [Vicinamibacterales bacterium]